MDFSPPSVRSALAQRGPEEPVRSLAVVAANNDEDNEADPESALRKPDNHNNAAAAAARDTFYGKFVLTPALAVKRGTWGTPRRRACTTLTLLILFILFVYLAAKLVETLKIIDAEPSMRRFTLGGLCDRYQTASLTLEVYNPSSTATTLLGMKSPLYFKSSSNDTNMFIGYAITPPVHVRGGPGASDIHVEFELDFPATSRQALHSVIKQYIEGGNVTLVVNLPMVASFSADVFLVPITFSTDFQFEFPLPSFSQAAAEAEEEEEAESYLQDVQLLPARDPAKYVKAGIGLQLWNVTEQDGSKMTFSLPSMNFDLYLNNELTATGRSEELTYGDASADQHIRVTGAVGEENLAGVHFAINFIFNNPGLPVAMPFSLVVLGEEMNHTEYATMDNAANATCHVRNLLQGLRIDMSMSSNLTTSQAPAEEDVSYFKLRRFELASVDAWARFIRSALTIDLSGVMREFFNVRGQFPVFDLSIQAATLEERYTLATVRVPQAFEYNLTHPMVHNLPVDVVVENATLALHLADIALLHTQAAVLLRVQPTGNTIASRLLRPLFFDFNLQDILSADVPQPPSSLRSRALLDASSNKSIRLNVSSDYSSVLGDFALDGFDTAYWGGTQILFKPFDLTIRLAKDGYNLAKGYETKPVLAISSTSGYDSDTGHLEFRLGMGDESVGALLKSMVTNLIQHQLLHFHASFAYNAAPPLTGPFSFQLSKGNETETSAATGGVVVSGESAASILSIKHAELLSLISNEISASVFFALDLGSEFARVDVSLPDIALVVTRCHALEPSFASLVLDAWSFSTLDRDARANFRAGMDSTSTLLDIATQYANGVNQTICLDGHPTLGLNFLSYFIGSLVAGIELAGMSSSVSTRSPTPTAAARSLITILDIQSDNATHACIQTFLHLQDQDEMQLGFSLGWGEARLAVDGAGVDGGKRFVAIQLDAGWFGPIDEYRIAKYDAPNSSSSTFLSLCFGEDASFVRNTMQTFYDGSAAFGIRATGTWEARRDDDSITATPMGLEIDFPATTFDTLSKIMSSSGQEQGPNATQEALFTLNALELLKLDGGELNLGLDVTMRANSLGFHLKTSPFQFHLGALATPGAAMSSEVRWFDLGLSLPEFGNDAMPVALTGMELNLTLLDGGGPRKDWGKCLDFVNAFLDESTDLTLGSSTNAGANLLSQILPTFVLLPARTGPPKTASPTTTFAPTSPDDYLQVDADITSAASSASILANFTLLERLGVNISFGEISIDLFDAGGDVDQEQHIGSLHMPGQSPLLDGIQGLNLTLQNAAPAFLRQLLMNASHVSAIAFAGRAGPRAFSAMFTLPVMTNDIVSEDSIASQMKITDVSLLGAGNVGLNGTLPCLFKSICTENMIRTDSQLSYAGITLGVTLDYLLLPELKRIRWNLSLGSDAVVNIAANGYELGKLALRPPLRVSSASTSFFPVLSFLPNHANLDETRDTIAAVMEGYDTVFTLSGPENENFLSRLMGAIEQDLAIVDVPEPDPNAPSVLQTMTLSILSATRNRVEMEVAQGILFEGYDLQASIGTVKADLYFGHSKTCGVGMNEFCLDGVNVASAETYGALKISPQPGEQVLKIKGSGFHTGGVLSTSQIIFDDLISRYVWSLEMPLEARVHITPTLESAQRYHGGGGVAIGQFQLTTFLTVPPGQALSGFIDSIEVDMTGTVTSTLSADLVVYATKVLRNTMSFPILVSYYQYVIKLIDTDGVESDTCGPLVGGLLTGINPCFFGFCYLPYTAPTQVAPLIQSSTNYAALMPGNSIITGKTMIGPGETGSTGMTIDVSTETGSRLADEMMTKGQMCGDISDGLIVIGLRAPDVVCNDENKLEQDLTCTFPLRVSFNLKDYSLGGTDSCGALMDVASYLPTTFYPDGLYQFNQAWSSKNKALNPNKAQVELIADDWAATTARSDGQSFSILDSFQITFEAKVGAHCTAGAGEAFALQFLANQPAHAEAPVVSMNCAGITCEARYASKQLQIAGRYSSLVFAYYQCNSIAWVRQGDIENLYRGSQSCAGRYLDNEEWGRVTFTYNAHDKRARVSHVQIPIDAVTRPERSFDFDLDLAAELEQNHAFLAFTANTGEWTCSQVLYRNFEFRGPRTNGQKTTLETDRLTLPVAGELGEIRFRARDENGRKRGRGGNTWQFQILYAETGLPAALTPVVGNPILDHGDGTYTLRYRINVRGRYVVKVACESGAAPDICNQAMQFATITNKLFVREATA